MNPKILFILLSFFAPHLIFPQNMSFINYSLNEGLPQSQVYCGFQDSHGYLWLGTQGAGICRFDGNTFQTFNLHDGLPSNYIFVVIEDKNNHIYIGSEKGLTRFDGKKMQTIAFQDKQPHTVTALFPHPSGDLWVGTTTGIYTLKHQSPQIQALNINPFFYNNAIHTFFQNPKGIWIGTRKGVALINSNEKFLTAKNGLKGSDIQGITQDKQGNIWIISRDGGAQILDENTWTISTYFDQDMGRLLCIYPAPDGDIWIGSEYKGIFIYHPSTQTWTQVSEANNLSSNHIRAIFSDRWENTWICTSGGGISKVLKQSFFHYNTSNGLSDNRIYAIHQTQEGKIWLAIGSDGINTYDSTGFQKELFNQQLSDIKAKSLLEDAQNRCWIGTEGKGIMLIDSGKTTFITQKEGIPSNFIRAITTDTEGNIWVATQANGIAKIITKDTTAPFQIVTYSSKEGMKDLFLTTLQYQKKEDKLWYATKSGQIGYFHHSRFGKLYQKQNGIPSTSIRSLIFDNQGYIWIATAGEGIYYSNLKTERLQFQRLDLLNQSHSDNIYSLVFDKAGNLWAGSETGVEQIIFQAPTKVKEVIHYGKNEGFLGIENCQNAALCDKNGNLWFGTMNGLIQYKASKQNLTLKAPTLHFTQISLFYQALEDTKYAQWNLPQGGIKQGLHLPYDQNNLSFEFKAIHLNTSEKILYRWKLIGQEDTWSPPSDRLATSYTNLLPGTYRFMVQASLGQAIYSDPIEAEFTIDKPFWQTLPFKIACITLFLAAIYAYIKYREKRIKEKEQALRLQLEMKNHILTLEQKALQLQMNPHFIFNVLNSIQLLVSQHDYDAARTEIQHFATLMRSILTNSRKQKITLAEEITTLDKYLKIEQFCQKKPFTYQIQSPTNMDSTEIELPPMLIQPFVENALIHGISHLGTPGHIQITFILTNNLLHCQITDNGIGREKSAALRNLQKTNHTSTAIDITQQRLKTMHTNPDFVSIEITDILHPNNQVAGTKVSLHIPVELAY